MCELNLWPLGCPGKKGWKIYSAKLQLLRWEVPINPVDLYFIFWIYFFFSVSGHSLLKDVVVAFSVLVATIGCWIAVLQKRKAKEQMERMIKDMKILQQAEDGLQELQIRFFS